MRAERVIEAKLRKQINKMGGRFYKWVSPGNDGVPDRIAVFPGGRIIFVELKTETGECSKVQEYQQMILEKLGCEVVTLYGSDAVTRFIEDLRHEVCTA